MNIDDKYFPNFVRAVNKAAKELSNEDIMELHGPFDKYLGDLSPRPTMMDEMCDISPARVIRRMGFHLGHISGYHPGLAYHFSAFIEKMMKEATKEGGKP